MKEKQENKSLSELESDLMEVVWSNSPCSAEEIRNAIGEEKVLKDSTIRTVLRRLEEKNYVEHEIEGRTYLYRPTISPHKAAAVALQKIINRFCGGSFENLLVGMVKDELLSPAELEGMVQKITENSKSTVQNDNV